MSLKSFGARNNLETIRLKLFSVQFGWTTRCISAGVRVTSIAKFFSETLRYDKKKAAKGENTSYGTETERGSKTRTGGKEFGSERYFSLRIYSTGADRCPVNIFKTSRHRTWWNQIPHSTWPWLRVRKLRCGISDSHSVSIPWVNSWRPWHTP